MSWSVWAGAEHLHSPGALPAFSPGTSASRSREELGIVMGEMAEPPDGIGVNQKWINYLTQRCCCTQARVLRDLEIEEIGIVGLVTYLTKGTEEGCPAQVDTEPRGDARGAKLLGSGPVPPSVPRCARAPLGPVLWFGEGFTHRISGAQWVAGGEL